LSQPQPVIPIVPSGGLRRVSIVGASLSGLSTASGLRDHGFDGEIVMIEAEAGLPPDRPPLSKQVLTGEWELERARQPGSDSLEDLDVDLRFGRRAVRLDVATRTLSLDDDGIVSADAVVLATGSVARRPPIPGIDRPGVHVLRTGADAAALRAGLAATPKRVLIVGAGFIGLEVAGSARELGLPVTVVEAFSTPASRVLPPAVGMALAEAAIAAGVDLRTDTAVQALVGLGIEGAASGDADTPVAGARLSDGTMLAADLVLVAVGAAPATGWLTDTPGITLDDGVLADATCMAAPGIAVVGDLARWWHQGTGAFVRVEHWDNAIEMGRYAGARLMAGDRAAVEAYSPVPWLWSNQFGSKFQLAGHVGPDDALTWVDGTPEDRAWVGVTHDGTTVKSVIGYNRNAKVMRIRMRMDQPDGLALVDAIDG
jgi:3-phenylpropionate/trans-cinnamate dioxygenase ferredoxin reductase subunit